MNTYTNIETKSIDLAPGNAESAHATQTMAARETVEGVGLPFDMLMRGPRAVATFFKNSPLLVHHSSPVRIAILGAEKQDMACNGGLYQLLPELLGDHSLQLRVDLVGPDVLPDFANVDLTTIGLRPAVCHAKSAGEWWASVTKERRPDVIFVFHPGMEKWHEEWLRADELPIILRSGIPTVFYSYDLDESQRDAHILSLHGAHLDLQPTAIEDNLPVSKVGLADFGCAYFSVRGFSMRPTLEVDDDMFAIEHLAYGLGEGFLHSGVFMRHADMGKIEVVLREGVTNEVMHLISDVYLDQKKEELFVAQNGVECSDCKPVPAPGLSEALEHQQNDFERALRIGEIFGVSRIYWS